MVGKDLVGDWCVDSQGQFGVAGKNIVGPEMHWLPMLGYTALSATESRCHSRVLAAR